MTLEFVLDSMFDASMEKIHPALRTDCAFTTINKSRSKGVGLPWQMLFVPPKVEEDPFAWVHDQAKRQNYNSVYTQKTALERWSYYIVNKSIYKKDPSLFYWTYLAPFESDGYVPLLEPYYNILRKLKNKQANAALRRQLRQKDNSIRSLAQSQNIYNLLSEEVLSLPGKYKFVYKSKKCVKPAQPYKLRFPRKYKVKDTSTILPDHYIAYLKRKIREKRNLRPYNYVRYYPKNDVQHQMDIPEHGDEGGKMDKAGNVLIEQSAAISKAVPTKSQPSWIDFVSSDTITMAQNLTDRWIEISDFNWSTNSNVTTPLLKLTLPKDFVKEDGDKLKSCDTPNFVLYRLHAYSACDIVVKLLVNSVKFQAGCLQLSWVYQAHNDHHMDRRENIYTLSQTPHARVYAGTQSECEISIPFQYSLSMLYNQSSNRVVSPLDMGNLYVMIVNPLTVGQAVTNKVHCTVQVKLTNTKFTGMRAGNVPSSSIESQMMGVGGIVTTMAAMRLLDTYMPDPNRDNPPLNAEASYVVPTANHSWCAGTGRIDVSKILRLDTRGQTHHPIGASPTDVFSVNYIKRQKGLLNQYTLSANTSIRCSEIFNIAVEPMFGKISKSYKLDYEINTAYCLPPISVLSSLFNYWRGEIDFEIDVVASCFHTYKLLFAYIPNAPATGVTFNMAQNSPHVIVSGEGPKNVTVRIPYVANQRWWPRTYTGNYELVSASAPSRFYCFLNNEIVRQNSASNDIYINVYVSGAPSFEVAVPVQPSIGLESTLYYFPSDSNLKTLKPDLKGAKNISIILEKDNVYEWVPRIVAKFTDKNGILQQERIYYQLRTEFSYRYVKKVVDERIIYIVEIRDRYVNWNFECTPIAGAIVRKELIFGVLLNDISTGQSTLIPALTRRAAFSIADKIQYFNYNASNIDTNLKVQLFNKDLKLDTTNTRFLADWVGGSACCDLAIISGTYAEELKVSTLLDLELQNGENSPAASGNLLVMGRSLASTGYGHLDFGESFNDLYNLCRRPQLYGSIKLTKAILTNTDKCAFIFTVNPQGLGSVGLRDSTDPEQVLNRCREGPIPILLSAFRYFRGSLRFRLVFPSCKNTLVWVQHRPDRPSRPRMLESCGKITTAQAVFNHGYASELQLCNINSTVQFEVPYYQYDHYGLLQVPEDQGKAFDYQYGLGQICVGIKASPEDLLNFEDKYCEIYYSLADDFSPSVYYGFPQMIFLDDLPSIEHQMGLWNTMKDKTKNFLKDNIREEWEDSKEEVKEEVSEIADEIIAEKINKVKQCIEEGLHDDVADITTANRNLTMLNILTNILHVTANFNAKSIAIAVVSLFVNMGLFAAVKIEKLYNIVTKIMSHYDATQQPNTNQHQGPSENEEKEEVASWVSMVFGGVCSLFAVSQGIAAPSEKKFETFLKHFSYGMRGSNAVFTFIKNSFISLKKMFKYLLFRYNPEYRNLQKLNTDSEVLKAWISEVLYLTDPTTYDKMYADRFFVDRVHAAVDYGAIFIVNIMDAKIEPKFVNTINALYKKLVDLKGQLNAMGEDPHIRREPFGIYMAGSPGIGKSSVREDICIELLQAVNYKFDSVDTFCVINPTAKHWDQCRKQPVLVLDDLWNIQTGEMLYEQISIIFQIFSSVVLCPPKAAVEEKTMRYNPRIVWMNSNYEFLKVEGADMSAVNRRRNVLVIASQWYPSSEEFGVPGCPHCAFGLDVYNKADPNIRDTQLSFDLSLVPHHFLKDKHHMRFFICHDKFYASHTMREGPFTYSELVDYLKEKFVAFDNNETKKYQERLQRYRSLSEQFLQLTSIDDERVDRTFSTLYFDKVAHEQNVMKEELEAYRNSWSFVINNNCAKTCEFVKKIDSRLKQYCNEMDLSFIPFVKKAQKLVEEEKPPTVTSTKDDFLSFMKNHRVGYEDLVGAPIETIAHSSKCTPEETLADILQGVELQGPGIPKWYQLNIDAAKDGKVIKRKEGINFYSEEAYREFLQYTADLALEENKKKEFCPGIFKQDDGTFATETGEVYFDARAKGCRNDLGQPNVDILAMMCAFIHEHRHEEVRDDMYIGYNEMPVLNKFCLNYYALYQSNIITFKAHQAFGIRLAAMNKVGAVYAGDEFYQMFNRVVESCYANFVYSKAKFENVFKMVVDNTPHLDDCPHAGRYVEGLACVNNVLVDTRIKGSVVDMGRACNSPQCPFLSLVYTYFFYRAWLNSNFVYRQAYVKQQFSLLPKYFADEHAFRDTLLHDTFDKLAYFWTNMWESRLGTVAKFFIKVLKWVAPLIAIVCINHCIKEKFTPSSSSKTTWGDPQSTYDPSSKSTPSTTKSPSGRIYFQGSQQSHHIVSTLSRNMFYLVVVDNDNKNERLFRCVGLKQRVAIGLKHYFECIDYLFTAFPGRYTLLFQYCNSKGHYIPDGHIKLDYKTLKSRVKYSHRSLDSEDVTNTNLALFELPVIVPYFKDISKFIATNEELKSAGSEGMFADGSGKEIIIRLTRKNINIQEGVEPSSKQKRDALNTPSIDSPLTKANATRLYSWWQYGMQQQGFCGSLILSTNLERPIVGIHVAGNPKVNYGFAEMLNSELFTDIPFVSKFVKDYSLPDCDDSIVANVELQGPLVIVGGVTQELSQKQPFKTSIKKTVIHGNFPVDTFPNPLRKGEPPLPEYCDPLVEGVNKHGQFVKDFDTKLLDRAFNDLKNKIISEVVPVVSKVEVLSDEVAICGDKNIPEMDALAWDTSAGFPLVKHKPANEKGKKWLFNLLETNEGYKLRSIHPKLQALLDINRNLRKDGIVPFTVFSDCLKDTCIPKEKLSIPGKTRIFSISPIHYTIDYKKHFLPFMASYRRNRIHSEHAIGINVDSIEWTKLVHYITEVGSNIIVGDYSNFGPGLNIQVAMKAADIMIEWNKFHEMNEADLDVCRILNLELIDRYHLCSNTIYKPPAGSPSGGPSTDIINSLVNCLYIRMAWLDIVKKPLNIFHEHVRLVVYGDDLIMSVSDSYINLFNGLSLSDWFKSYDIKFTDALKTGELVSFRSLETSSFLKRSFTLHPFLSGVYLAPIDINSVHSCLNWVKGSLKNPVATEENIRAAIDLLYGHGPCTFKLYIDKLLKLSIDFGLKIEVFDWVELDYRNFSELY